MKFLKRPFCRHKDLYVLRWHYVHWPTDYDPALVEMEVICHDCGKYMFVHSQFKEVIDMLKDEFMYCYKP